VSRAVCRNCWTWYSKGETACPTCHVPLTAADTAAELPPPPAAVQPTAVAPVPVPAPAGPSWQRINWLQSAIGGIVLVGLIVAGVLLAGALGPVSSSDGALSVKVPQGWARGQGPHTGNGKVVLAVARIKNTSGVEAHIIVGDLGHFFPLADVAAGWQQYAESGTFPVAGTIGLATPTTVAGAPALTADFQGSKYAGQILFVDYGQKTYIIELSSDESEFAQLRESDFAAILSSWEWH
jgi:hypothetical protein